MLKATSARGPVSVLRRLVVEVVEVVVKGASKEASDGEHAADQWMTESGCPGVCRANAVEAPGNRAFAVAVNVHSSTNIVQRVLLIVCLVLLDARTLSRLA